VNGSGFWLSGMASVGGGFRYLPSLDAGRTEIVSGANADEAGWFDARGVVAYGGQLYGSDSVFTPAPGGVGVAGTSGFSGIFTVGSGLPTSEAVALGTNTTLLPGFDGTETTNIWTFVFQNDSSIWAAGFGRGIADCFGGVTQYVRVDGVWSIANVVCIDLHDAVNSVAGRYEGADWIVYGNTIVGLFRLVTSSLAVTKIAEPASNRYFQSVAVAPRAATPSPSASPSASASPSCSPSSSFSSQATAAPPDPLDVVVVRLGETSYSDVGVGRAYTLWLDVYTVEGLLRRSLPLTGGACRLSRGDHEGIWLYDTDGLVSLSADGRLLSLPCYAIDEGAPMSIGVNKTVVTFSYTGDIAFSAPIQETYGDPEDGPYSITGMRQAATVNGSGFWLSGEASIGWGFRYLPALDAGSTNFVDGAFGTDAGALDARGVVAYGGQLYGSDSPMDQSASGAGFGGIFAIGAGLPTFEDQRVPSTDVNATLLPGFNGTSQNVWTFVFESDASIWAAFSNGTVLDPTLYPTDPAGAACGGGVTHYALIGGA
jgi:hypothetical protein